jgi:hypothetical protein
MTAKKRTEEEISYAQLWTDYAHLWTEIELPQLLKGGE